LRKQRNAHGIEHFHLSLQLIQLRQRNRFPITKRGPGRIGGAAAMRKLGDCAWHQPGDQQDGSETGEQKLVVLAEKFKHKDRVGWVCALRHTISPAQPPNDTRGRLGFLSGRTR